MAYGMNSAGYCHCYFWYVSPWKHTGEKFPCHSAPKSINQGLNNKNVTATDMYNFTSNVEMGQV